MRKIYFLFFILFSAKLFSQTDVQLSPNFTYNGESNLAVDPNNPDRMALGCMRVTGLSPVRLSIEVYRTSNGGQTWQGPVALPLHGTFNTCADPTFAFGNNGTLYAGYINYKTTADSGATYVCISTNGGQTFDNGHVVINGAQSSDEPLDRPWLIIDNNPGSPYEGRMYVVTKSYKDAPLPHKIWLMVSTDSAQTWSQPLWVDSTIKVGFFNNSMGVPAIAADGKLFIEYFAWDTAVSLLPQMVFASSSNGGASLSYQGLSSMLVPATAFPAADTFYQFSYHLAANPQNAQQLVSIWTDNRNGDPDIYMIRSVNEGSTWSAPVRLNDDSTSNGAGQDMCWAGFSPAGTYAAAWRDRRNASTTGQNADFMIYATASTDGGATFLPDFAISSGSSPVIQVVEGNDFIGLGVTDSCIRATWADLRGSSTPLLYTNQNCSQPLAVPLAIAENSLPAVFFNETERNIHVETASGAKVSVIDMNGKVIYETIVVDHPLLISTQSWPAGVYTVNVQGKIPASKKILVK